MSHLENCSIFKYLSVDTEGYAPNILGISIAHPALESMYFPVGHREDVNIDEETNAFLKHVLTSVPYRVFHNAGHDLIALSYLFDLPFICTMIMGHMVNENIMAKSLDYMHKIYCPGSKYAGKQMDPLMASIIKTMGWYYVPYALLYNYATVDAYITMELFQKILPLYEEQFDSPWSVT
jgi:hypothetical protein